MTGATPEPSGKIGSIMGAIGQETLRALLRLWDGKRQRRRCPARRDFAPEELAPWLGDIYLMDVVRDETRQPVDFRFRLFGSALATTYQIEPTGRLLSEVPSMVRLREDEMHKLAGDFLACVRERLPCYDRHCAILADRPHVVASRLALPLAGDGTTVDMLLVCVLPLARRRAAA